MKNYYFKAAPKAPLFKVLTYRSSQKLRIGQRVKIPLGKKTVNGLIIEEDLDPISDKEIKEILEIDKYSPPLSLQRLRWLQWMSAYYHYPLGLVAELNFPQEKFLKKEKAAASSPPFKNEIGETLLEKEKAAASSPPSLHQSDLEFSAVPSSGGQNSFDRGNPQNPNRFGTNTKFVTLTPDQQKCAESILKSPSFQVHLIHGVTGSGKTEVYKALIARHFQQGQQVLVLLPEIFLIPQIVMRFSESFPNQTVFLHSQISKKQKKRIWAELLSGEKKLLVGARSALFHPLPRLGCIIVDEEHDSSFKQEDKFRYHARDSAIVLAKELDIPIILGSATPDFSSYQKALAGSYKLHELKKRAFKQELPKVSIIDLRNKPNPERPFWLSDFLFDKIQETLRAGRQAALFLNRRGQATAFLCVQCGHIRKCLNCDISLTLHGDEFLLCHYCSYFEKKTSRCPSCQGDRWLEKGLGTQKVQKEMEKYFPDYQTLRVDRDTISSQEDIERFMSIVEKKRAHILVGTQMLAKGLNFPSIYLVGLILADMDFHFPDFRAGERAFQTLLQMAGRAGRASFGEVALQTFNPDHVSIVFAKQHDYKGFFSKEIKSRKKLLYPPFARLCLLQMDSLKEESGRIFAKELTRTAKDLSFSGITILGPGPAPLTKIKNRYRFQILIKGKDHRRLNSFLQALLPKIPKKSSVQVKVDRDPHSMF